MHFARIEACAGHVRLQYVEENGQWTHKDDLCFAAMWATQNHYVAAAEIVE
jgi:hypothetical protein